MPPPARLAGKRVGPAPSELGAAGPEIRSQHDLSVSKLDGVRKFPLVVGDKSSGRADGLVGLGLGTPGSGLSAGSPLPGSCREDPDAPAGLHGAGHSKSFLASPVSESLQVQLSTDAQVAAATDGRAAGRRSGGDAQPSTAADQSDTAGGIGCHTTAGSGGEKAVSTHHPTMELNCVGLVAPGEGGRLITAPSTEADPGKRSPSAVGSIEAGAAGARVAPACLGGPLSQGRHVRPVKMCGAGSNSNNVSGPVRSLILNCKVGSAKTPSGALVDSGAERNFVSEGWVKHAGLSTSPIQGGPLRVVLAKGSCVNCTTMVTSLLTLDGWSEPGHELYVVPMSNDYQVILGMPWLVSKKAQFDWDDLTVTVFTGVGDTTATLRSVAHQQARPDCLLSAVSFPSCAAGMKLTAAGLQL